MRSAASGRSPRLDRQPRVHGDQLAAMDFKIRRPGSRWLTKLDPHVDLALGRIVGDAAALLYPARQLGALAFDELDVIVGELAPLLTNLAFDLLPVAFDTVPIHRWLLPGSLQGVFLERRSSAHRAPGGNAGLRKLVPAR